MGRRAAICLVLALAVAGAGCGGGGGGNEGADELTVRLTEQAGSGQDGTATLRAVGDAATEVVIEISNPAAEIQPAHIHAGTCEQLDPNPAYALTSVDGGRSVTELSVSLGELRDAELVVNVHKSEAEIATYAACGALP